MNQTTTNRLCLKFAADVVGIPLAQDDFTGYIQSRGMDASGVPMALAYLTEAKFLERTGTVASPEATPSLPLV